MQTWSCRPPLPGSDAGLDFEAAYSPLGTLGPQGNVLRAIRSPLFRRKLAAVKLCAARYPLRDLADKKAGLLVA